MPRISLAHGRTVHVTYVPDGVPRHLDFEDGVADVNEADVSAVLRCLPGTRVLFGPEPEQDSEQGDAENPVGHDGPAEATPVLRNPRRGTKEQ